MLPPAPLPESPQDVAALLRQSLAAASEAVAGPLPRDAALGVFRRHLARIQTHVRDTFELGNLPGLKAARMLAGLTDGLIAELFDHAVASVGGTAGGGLWGLGRSGRLAIAATGGYGRGVLAPFSDIDLLFLTDGRPTAQVQRVVEFMLYFLWDLGLKVGHATRSKADCLTEARGDHTVRTSLLDARRVTGDAALFIDFAATFRTACTEAGAAGFMLADGQLLPVKGREFHQEPIQMLRILQVARDRDLKLHPLAVRGMIRNERRAQDLRDNPEAAALFLDLLCGRDAAHNRADGARWLAILNETGLLGRFLPDWARVVGQMQFDTYHVFTVDEHTIEAVRVLNTLERGELAEIAPVASGLVDHLQSRRALYVAMLLHDIAKGRGGDHSELGAEVAQVVGPTLGLSAEETEMVSWLVLHHLLLSQTAFKRDIDDPKTILDLVETIQSPERLRLLLVLTVADMRAVSPKVWNGWKATLLRDLYARVGEVLAGGLSTTERDVRVSRARQAAALLLPGWSADDLEKYLALGYPGYWLSFDPESHARHARLIRQAEQRGAPLTVETQPLPDRAVTEVTVYAADHAGLFSRIAGALAVAGASIVDARIHTLTNGMALDTFWIQDAARNVIDAPAKLARLSVLIEQSLSGRLRLSTEIRKMSQTLLGARLRAMHVPPRVVIDNHASNTHTVLEVNGRDRPGLLHDVTAAISDQGLQIASAHVTTYGQRAVDVFYVKDVFGLKVENERRLAQLRDALLDALGSPDDGRTAAVPLPAKRGRAADAA